MKLNTSNRFDLSGRYLLAFGIRVIQRSPNSVQIGTEAPRQVVIADAPPESVKLLAELDGVHSAAQVIAANNADPQVWARLLAQLANAELLVVGESIDRVGPAALPPAHLIDEAAGLSHRYGQSGAARIMQARGDAMVVIRGDCAVSAAIATMLAAAGIGHLHIEPVRAGRSLHAGVLPETARRPVGSRRAPDLVTTLRERYPTLRVHSPAAHQHPTLVVLVGAFAPDLGLAATLSRSRVPHLAVATGVARSVVGPLVLPGRSSCLSCAHRHRVAADPDWPTVARQLADLVPKAPAQLTAIAACLSAGEVLDHVDGSRPPSTVNGTLEWRPGDLGARRRSWTTHPECGCIAK
ncbi:MAG: hypothetical protein ABWZ02_05620, partial [Nakamurella sp.]